MKRYRVAVCMSLRVGCVLLCLLLWLRCPSPSSEGIPSFISGFNTDPHLKARGFSFFSQVCSYSIRTSAACLIKQIEEEEEKTVRVFSWFPSRIFCDGTVLHS
ncbi:hypothetical protein F4776DRAFT_598085 [Hypoxylon sp. NC0597]|nr:hypothetical protein F4776DRAFT_598085 [Hypoxylon sp. NC0597]